MALVSYKGSVRALDNKSLAPLVVLVLLNHLQRQPLCSCTMQVLAGLVERTVCLDRIDISLTRGILLIVYGTTRFYTRLAIVQICSNYILVVCASILVFKKSLP